MNETVKAWQCIGCGKIEAPQTCIGVCQDRKVEFVYASEHKDALNELAQARRQLGLLEALAAAAGRHEPAQRWLGAFLSGVAGTGSFGPGRNRQ